MDLRPVEVRSEEGGGEGTDTWPGFRRGGREARRARRGAYRETAPLLYVSGRGEGRMVRQ